MRLELAYITPRRQRLKSGSAQQLLADYVQRATRYTPVAAVPYDSEASLLQALERASGRPGTARTPGLLVALDSRGEMLSSEAFAARLRRWQDAGQQVVTFAIGPADGWSPAARSRAHLEWSLGAITLPHELALVVLAEQIYRALTILAGHPYHAGHG